jgi:signal transduction histidine kinase
MHYETILLFTIAALNAFFSYFVLHGQRKVTNILFSLVAVSIGFWAIGLGLFLESTNFKFSLMFANFYYLSAAAIPVLFFYFCVFFQNGARRLNLYHYTYLIGFFVLAVLFVFDQNIIIKEIYFTDWGKDVVLNKSFYLAYGIFFLVLVAASYFELWRISQKNEDVLVKIQLKFIVLGTSIAYILGMIFNLFLPYLGNYQLIWLGPFFTLVMVISIAYAIFKHHLFSIKVVTTEILVFSFWLAILFRTFISETLSDKLINGIFLVSSVILGIFLIKSVIKEVETREKIELLAKDLSSANERLQFLDKQKSEFVSIASHQLRSPLTAIKGYASMLIEGSYGNTEPKVKEAIERVFQSAQNLMGIVDDLLNITRLEQGRMEYVFEKVDLSALTKEIVDSLFPNALNKKLKLTFENNKAENYSVNADLLKIRQVILNLVDNAIKYTKEGSVEVNVSKVNGGKVVRVAVTDSGVGITPELRSRLFEKFSRGDEVSKLHANGTGLGLYIAKQMVEAHKGTIGVDSDGEGKGSTFYIELPTLG